MFYASVIVWKFKCTVHLHENKKEFAPHIIHKKIMINKILCVQKERCGDEMKIKV
jgi:hypothetical protein